ncbi:hypothetical protein BGW36DRAFT_362320 [Talaromyces proteolyticus]|uniref:Uncharacterized protein n=1 Tax=Talaromyces proteolyticus TaxID=1131652 RepID=A0AAD4KMR7_9EURO|nr:uncharacterized protein BGW36DRAFT_362320 [Talaromyces proteolyticus]KAH8692770.1 hypothetical protein BGW36DRAFT_362320 [Talaromyces proteolyticus]
MSFTIENLHEIAITRTHDPKDPSKADLLRKLVGNLSPEQWQEARKAYVDRFYVDPEHHLRNFDVYQEFPPLRLDPNLLLELLGILNKPDIDRDIAYIERLLTKANSRELTLQDRKEYFSWLPRIGLWDSPARQPTDNRTVDSYERRLRIQAWEKVSPVRFDYALKTIESAFPKLSVKFDTPRDKNIAAIASSHGAQWQELVDWAIGVLDAGYAVQVFTPYGRPIAIQRDSMLVREPPTEAVAVSLGLPGVGLGAPLRLDPLRLPKERIDYLLGNAVGADLFDPSQFGAVYLAGGLGFNEDVAITAPKSVDDDTHANITPTPHVLRMMNDAISHRLPIIALCHGPTLLACLDINIDGKREKLVKGVQVAALPALEPMVHAQGKLESQFSFYTWKTHDVLAEAGAIVDEQADLQDMTIVKTGVRDGLHIATGPGPQTALNLRKATISAINSRWGRV